jgi:hypothetical protein
VITVRPLRLPDDRGAVEQIDASVPIDAAWVMHSTSSGFELVLRALGEPRVKRYVVAVDELASAAYALVAEHVNAPALAFYRRCGFALCGLDASLYEPTMVPDEIALFLVKQLS